MSSVQSKLRTALAAAAASAVLLVSCALPAAAASVPKIEFAPAAQTLATQTLPEFEISIVPGSHINLVSSASRVPVQIRNGYDTDIRIFIWVRPSNLSVKMPKVFEFTAAANTTSNAAIPVEAIANGEVRLNVWLTSFSGVKIGKSTNLEMTVRRDVEGSILIAFFVVVGALGAIGTSRMLKRNKVGSV
ncbi:MAG: DUF6049 family protein [Micrococcales bacterium]